jgi:hypothetical protein
LRTAKVALKVVENSIRIEATKEKWKEDPGTGARASEAANKG